MEFVVDTYGAIEYFKGNQKYFEAINIANKLYTTQFMLAELYFHYIKDKDEEMADKYFEMFTRFLEPMQENDLKEAMMLRLKLKKRGLNISYADAIGYHTALSRKAKFLTGDEAFEELPNVEFIK